MKYYARRRALAAQRVKRKRAGKAKSRLFSSNPGLRKFSLKVVAFLNAFFAQIMKGSVRAIAALSVAAFIVFGIPLMIILLGGNKEKAVDNTNEGGTPKSNTLVLEGEPTFSAAAQNMDDLDTDDTLASTPEPHPNNTIFKRGMSAPVVAEIQERLMELGYLDWDEPTELYGPNTQEAVTLFQRKHGLTQDGCLGAEAYNILISDEAKKYSVSLGDEGHDIQELQKRLYELGYLTNKATQYFGTETEAAVKKFQERNGLSADGSVGEKTREMLYSEDAKANYFERGEVSDVLKKYQERLKKLGYLTTEADGKYGNDTENAVKRFQERTGLIADGYLGPETIAELMSSNAQANAIMIGMKGSDVEKIQKRLKELGYLTGKADGYFGSGTESAVINFQRVNKLSQDGKVGKNTLNALISSGAKKSDGNNSSPGGSSGSSSSSGSGSSSSSGSDNSGSKITAPSGASLENFIAIAESKVGSKYVRGGKGPNTFDCSGFVYWCLNQAGVKVGYMTSSGWRSTTKFQRISGMSNLERGDIVSFRGHVGIYLGNGKMVDASSGEGKVRITGGAIQSSAYWKKNFICGYRIF